ncbi:hypothetical protein PHLCEN_2v13204, partial [Hermanssonia centrifuga]
VVARQVPQAPVAGSSSAHRQVAPGRRTTSSSSSRGWFLKRTPSSCSRSLHDKFLKRGHRAAGVCPSSSSSARHQVPPGCCSSSSAT